MKLKTISQVLNEAMDPNYRKWRKNNVSYRGSRKDDPLDGIDEYDGKFGKGLYSTPSSNKTMTKDYGTRFILVGAVPSNPLKFRNVNEAEIWLQQMMIRVMKERKKGEDDIDSLRNFHKYSSIEKEVTKLGYDGIMIVGREMVLFNPKERDVKVFKTEKQLEMWYDDFHAGETESMYPKKAAAVKESLVNIEFEFDDKNDCAKAEEILTKNNIKIKSKSSRHIQIDANDRKKADELFNSSKVWPDSAKRLD